MGRPPTYSDDPVTKTVSLRVGLRHAVAINSITSARGCTKQEFFRQAIDDAVEDELDRPIYRKDKDAVSLYDSLTPYQIRAINSLSAADPRIIRGR
jgi:hypothetical protein